jgi:ubiquinone/menaquinone biosynthesis C-methylase UbiE
MQFLSRVLRRLAIPADKASQSGVETVARTIAEGLQGAASHAAAEDQVEKYWTAHNVTSHRRFSSPQASLTDLSWRNAQYFGYLEHMPVRGADAMTILDFGCGPGYDLVGFATQSKPAGLIGIDVSAVSLAEARERLELHAASAELHHHNVLREPLPLADATVDLVHCSGVLHHMPDIEPALAEFRRVLKPGGHAHIMVYHAESLWLHLYVAYEQQVVQELHAGLGLLDAFQKSTDGPDCPVSRCYSEQQFVDLVAPHGFIPEHFGVAVSAWEMSLLPKRYAAIMDRRVPAASRDFLASLTFDERGLPLVRPGVHAGIDGCYHFRAI